MSKVGKDLIKAMSEVLEHTKCANNARRVYIAPVQVPATVDVAAIRHRLALTQSEFAARFGFSPGNVRNWEQGHREPDGVARVYLKIIENHPKVVDEALVTLRTEYRPSAVGAIVRSRHLNSKYRSSDAGIIVRSRHSNSKAPRSPGITASRSKKASAGVHR
jgi:putative transcriptional regulator